MMTDDDRVQEEDTGLGDAIDAVIPDASDSGIQMIPIASIRVVNPRERSKKKFREIVTNIGDIGLKKPITVRPRTGGKYDLICGQGRLEAFTLLGQAMVPAIIRDVSEEDALVMSLVENIARRKPSTMETVRALVDLRDRGYTPAEIGEKTGIAPSNVREFLYLYDHGEEKLLAAVDAGRIPLSVAVVIGRSNNDDVQAALAEAFERKQLTTAQLHRARNIADIRKTVGTPASRWAKTARPQAATTDSVVRAFKRELDKQRQALKKAELCEARLVFVVNAVKALFRDDNFVNLLRAENLETVPEYLADELKKGASSD